MLQYVIPFTHRSECRLETPLCNSALWNCHTGCISLKPCIIDCKCRTVVKFLSLGKVQALQIWSALFAVRGSQPEALCISFSPGQGKSDLAPVLLSSSERRAGNCMRNGQQQRRGSGYPTPWGCNKIRLQINVCLPFTVFFLLVFFHIHLLSLAFAPRQAVPVYHPAMGPGGTDTGENSSSSIDEGCRSHRDNYVWHNNWHPAPLCLCPGLTI